MGRTEDLLERGRWPRDSVYWIEPVRIAEGLEHGIIELLREEPSGAGDEGYSPMEHRELPGEFAKLAGGGHEAVLDFAKRFGHLGFREASRQAFELPQGQRQIVLQMPPGDPMPWIINHASAINLAMRLSAVLHRPKELSDLLGSLAVSDYVDGATGMRDVIVFPIPWRGWLEPQPIILPIKEVLENAQQEAGKIVCAILDRNLEGVSRFVSTRKGGFNSSFHFRSLIDCIYWLTADAITEERIRNCAHCRRPFVVTDDRMLYCPHPLGGKLVSPCMNRAKVRRYRTQGKKGSGKTTKQRSVPRRKTR